MQVGNVQIGPPIATIKRAAANEIQRATNDTPLVLSHNQQHPVGHCRM